VYLHRKLKIYVVTNVIMKGEMKAALCTWTSCSLMDAGMISDPKSFAVGYLHLRSFNKTSVLNTYTPIEAINGDLTASSGDNPRIVVSTCCIKQGKLPIRRISDSTYPGMCIDDSK
jgi:hypothetical protein